MSQIPPNVLDDPLFWVIYHHKPGWNKFRYAALQLLDKIIANPHDSEAISIVLNTILSSDFIGANFAPEGLIALATQTEQPGLQQIALTYLDNHKNYTLRSIFRHWYYKREAILEPLILTANTTDNSTFRWDRGVHLALKRSQLERVGSLTHDTIFSLVAACSDSDPVINANARLVLYGANQEDLQEIASAWDWSRDATLLEVLVQRDFLTTARPAQIPVNLYLKLDRLDLTLLADIEIAEAVADALKDKDPDIAANARQVLSQLSNPAAQEAVCQIIIKGERPDLVEIAVAAGYTPADLTNRAVFYILTEQWEKYAALGMDPLMVQMVYRTGAADLRKRLSRHIQASGRPELLQLLAGSNRALTAAELSRETGRILLETLEKEQKWGQLWGLLPELPLRRGLQVLNRLAALPDWQPANQTEEALFAELKTLAAGPMLTSAKQIERFIPASLKLYSPWLLQFCESPGDATNDFNLFQNFKAGEGYAALPESLKNTLAYIEALMRYRWQYAIELSEVEGRPLSQFDVELT